VNFKITSNGIIYQDVKIYQKILKKNLNYHSILDQIGNQKIYILVVLDCLWNSIIGNKRNEEQFIELDGLFTLFELLEESDAIHIKIILSCIASLVDNKRSFSYFIQWKSYNSNANIDATKLLINIYREEDKKYGVEYEDGILRNYNGRPLNPTTSYNDKKREKLKLGNISSVRDWLYVDDVCSAVDTCIKNQSYNCFGNYNISSYNEYPVLELLKKAFLFENNRNYENYIDIDVSNFRLIDTSFCRINSEKIRRLGWEPKYDIDSTLKIIIKAKQNANQCT